MKKLSFGQRFSFRLAFGLALISILIAVRTASATTANEVRLLITGSDADARAAAQRLESEPIDSIASWIEHFSGYPRSRPTNGFVHLTHRINGSVDAPAFLYVPSKWNPNVKRPLVIYMHGGVGKREFAPYTDTVLIRDDKQIPIAEEHNWFYLFPEARYDCAWWSPAGMDNIQWLIREAKKHYPIDDDRVNASGFSDGASGAYQFGMVIPTDFAQFFPWSGYIASGSLYGDVQQNIANLRNRPMYATTGGKDRLYPTAQVLPLLQQAQKAGADLHIMSFDTANHDAGYMRLIYPEFEHRVEHNKRNSFKTKLYWETSDLRYASVDWLAITELDLSRPPASWYVDYNESVPNSPFPRRSASGAVSAHFANNRFELQTSRVSAVTLYIHPKMIRMGEPVTVVVNGKTVFEGTVQPDAKWMLENYLEKRDRGQLWQAKLEVKIP